ncbi:uncharacterized protein LOC106077525 [Biomphalaria glabrata]|uniref:Uncharacterized protein LOC106077525 n=1 Tax=Biomphalaria glabrata TaxID=6526 RepID=A0A9W2Z616_BIOGL|nr:uncharacterized protein LOC106077525 [Biomphalaria glabrata]
MDLTVLNDYVPFLEHLLCDKDNVALTFIYHETKYYKLLKDDAFTSVSPCYSIPNSSIFKFRGCIEKQNKDYIRIGLDTSCLEERNPDFKGFFSISLYNTKNNDYLLIGSSEITSNKEKMNRDYITVQISFLEELIGSDEFLVQWKIYTLSQPSNNKHSIEKGSINSIKDLVSQLSKYFNDAQQTESHLEFINNEMLLCQEHQYDNRERLEAIEKQCLNLNQTIFEILQKVNCTAEKLFKRDLSHSNTSTKTKICYSSNSEESINESLFTFDSQHIGEAGCESLSSECDSTISRSEICDIPIRKGRSRPHVQERKDAETQTHLLNSYEKELYEENQILKNKLDEIGRVCQYDAVQKIAPEVISKLEPSNLRPLKWDKEAIQHSSSSFEVTILNNDDQKSYSFYVTENFLVDSLIRMIEGKLRIPQECQSLMYSGNILQRGTKISEYNITDKSTLLLLSRLGGSNSKSNFCRKILILQK